MAAASDGGKQPPNGGDDPITFNEVLLAEMRALRPGAFENANAEGFGASAENRAADLRSLYTRVAALERLPRGGDADEGPVAATQGLSALCLSGGGIRSATFNLGVLQALARRGLLGEFDYLSSVSGGGYIAGWLRAWMTREGATTVIEQLGSSGATVTGNPLSPEPRPIDRLREYSNYLTPKLGLFSADTWTGAAIVVRNLLLNWLVIMPVIAAALTFPQIGLLVLQASKPPDWLLDSLIVAAAGAALFASILIYYARRFLKAPGTPQLQFVLVTVAPLWLSSLFLVTAAIWMPWSFEFPFLPSWAISVPGFAVLWCAVIPMIGWLCNEPRWRRTDPETLGQPWVELLALAASGAVAALVLAAVVQAREWALQRPALYVMVSVPALLGIYLLARALFVAMASGPSSGTTDGLRDADREWWARLTGWVFIVALIWLGLSAVCLLGDYLWQRFKDGYLTQIFVGMGGVSGIAASLLGKSADTGSGRGPASKATSPGMQLLLAAAAPLFCVCLLVLLAHGTAVLGRRVTGEELLLANVFENTGKVTLPMLLEFTAIPLVFIALSVVTGFIVNVNRFSLHGLYRNRLVRAYLGASNPARKPDPFTGFDPEDNLPLHALWKPATPDDPRAATRPLPVINVALNLAMSQEKLAWQQRKAESFSMTPFYCGNFHDGYRHSKDYFGRRGISLGTAITISGAAANPNMGYHSSPVIMFLMGLFNARLGAWLGNVNEHGKDTYRDPGPSHALRPLFAELFGWTSSRAPYVNLSDGGHFENLGLYEMVLRRCRYVLVSDSGCDPTAAFEDLANAIRKIRIDFGIPVEFEQKILISPRDETETGLYCATATIRYDEVDGDVAPGHLVYIKPALFGRGSPLPYDVYSYARSSKDFPHEPTADQWFSEAQFESYRALGLHVVEAILQERRTTTFAAFLERVGEYMAGGRPAGDDART